MSGKSLDDPNGWKGRIPTNAADLVDPLGLGRIPVTVDELQPKHNQTQEKYIWVYNKKGNNLYCTKDGKCNGAWQPPAYVPTDDSPKGTPVTVKFKAQDTQSGYIEDFDTSAKKESTPKGQATEFGGSSSEGSNSNFDTFRTNILASTPDGNNITIAGKNSTGAYANSAGSINVVYENGKSFIVINDSGVNIQSAGSLNVTVSGNINLKCSGNINIESSGVTNIKAGGEVNIDGSSINLNSGSAAGNDGCKGTNYTTQGAS